LREANKQPEVGGEDELPGKTNYFIGNDPEKWRTNVSTYAKVRYKGVYPGIDMVYYGEGLQMEYDFDLAPGADSNLIRLRFEGDAGLSLERDGSLAVQLAGKRLHLLKPVAYQLVNGTRREVAAEYALIDAKDIVFKVGTYDSTQPLIIDPVLSFSTFLGGTA